MAESSNNSKDRPPSIVLLSDNDEDNNKKKNLASIFTTSMETSRRTRLLVPKTPPRQRSKRNIVNDVEMIDLTTPHPLLYVPRTLHEYNNQQRLSILPAYINMVEHSDVSNLLLVNVPAHQLSSDLLARRQPSKSPWLFQINTTVPSKPSIMMKEYEKYFGTIVDRLKVDISILDYNYMRLNYFLQLFREARMRILPRDKCLPEQMILTDSELPMLLEFYLQMDVDLFYIKTGLFCSTSPHCQYTLTSCGHCQLCQQSSSILFNHYGRHRFVNGYESILNCAANCETKNLIYVITCYCQQADYISETKYALSTRLQDHRSMGHQIIRRFLLGNKNIRDLEQIEGMPMLASGNKVSMLLYQHFTKCSTAIQRFLDSNPRYWCFVPMAIDDVVRSDSNYQTALAYTTSMPLLNFCQDPIIRNYLANIPTPPEGYRFSQQQLLKQMEFFKLRSFQDVIHDRVDLFQTEIIAVLPPNSSDLFRQIIHSLFVTHTEAKLNTLGHVFDYATNRIPSSNERVWCASLQRR